MNHKVRGFSSFKGTFLHVDMKVCERLISQMSEADVMKFRGKINALIEEFYYALAAVKSESEEYEKALNEMEENAKTNT